MPEGAGIKDIESEGRVVARYPELRDMIYNYILKVGELNKSNTWDEKILGEWHFIPEDIVGPMMDADMKLLF